MQREKIRKEKKKKSTLSQVCPKSVPSDIVIKNLHKASVPVPITDLMKASDKTNRTRFRNEILKPLLKKSLVEMTIPEKPRSSKQKYVITEKGKAVLSKLENKS